MKQVFQNLKSGDIFIEDLPIPKNKKNTLLISTSHSVISSGTERMLIDFGKANYINKAKQQPEKVRQVIDKIKTDGIISTFETVKSKLNQPIPLGYCNVGTVIESNSNEFNIGDRVVSNGPHAEFVRVSENLCAKVPNNLDIETASLTILASIGLQAIRITSPQLGDKVVVSGLGIVGLLTVQMLIANGCDVLALDYNETRCNLAKIFGAKIINLSEEKNIIESVNSFSLGKGVDSVIVAASSESDEIIHQAAQFCRQRGSITLLGDVGLNLRRDDFYKKEIKFQVSSSYGPGRYDQNYEENGNDYPYGLVRWTSKRNFEAVLEMMKLSKIRVKHLITHKYKIDDFKLAYGELDNTDSLGIILEYNSNKSNNRNTIEITEEPFISTVNNNINTDYTRPIIGCIGAGNYASKTLIPALNKTQVEFHTIASLGSLNSKLLAKKYRFNFITTNPDKIFDEKKIDTVFIASPHNEHASQVIKALNHNKNIYVEKPLCINKNELIQIEDNYKANKNYSNKLKVIVGFNRRFSPLIKKAKKILKYKTSPKSIIYSINAGYIEKDNWIHNPDVGGGRIIGEVCHFIDLTRYIIDSPIKSFQVNEINDSTKNINFDTLTISLSFQDGSIASINYFSNGHTSYQKEEINIFCQNSILKIDNFKTLKAYGINGFKKMSLWRQDKGQNRCVKNFINSIVNKTSSPIPFEQIIEVSKLSIDIAESLWKK